MDTQQEYDSLFAKFSELAQQFDVLRKDSALIAAQRQESDSFRKQAEEALDRERCLTSVLKAQLADVNAKRAEAAAYIKHLLSKYDPEGLKILLEEEAKAEAMLTEAAKRAESIIDSVPKV